MKISAKDNKEIINIIIKELQPNRFIRPFDGMLIEVFFRMQYVLGLSVEELKEDIQNFNEGIKIIRWEHMEKKYAGLTKPATREINLNVDYFQNIINTFPIDVYIIKLFETFSHECIHGTQFRNNYFGNRAGGFNKKVNNRSHAIFEICTQAIAAKICRNRKIEDYEKGTILSGDGYSDEIFAVPLIASVFGVSEQTVMKYGVRERYKLIQALDKNIGNKDYTQEIIFKIEDELEMLHSISYPDDNQKKFKKLSEHKKSKMKNECMSNLINLCQSVLCYRIQNLLLDIDNKSIIELKNNQMKMNKTIINEFYNYGNTFMNYSQLNYLLEYSPNADYIKQSLNVLSDIVKDEIGKFSKIRLQLIDCVKRKDFNGLAKFNVYSERDITEVLVKKDNEIIQRQLYEDYNMLYDWDNTELTNTILQIVSNTEPIPVVKDYTEWNEERINSSEGIRKLNVLKNIARVTAINHDGQDIRYTLFEYINSNQDSVFDVYNSIIIDNNSRDNFVNEFQTDEDKEFLVKLIAKKYLDSIYDFDKEKLKNITSDNLIDDDVKKYLISTIEKFGKEHTMWAISKIILEGNYDSISNGSNNSRKELKLIGKKNFLDVISKPLMDELMKERVISNDFIDNFYYSIFRTEQKYPGQIIDRIDGFITEFKHDGVFNYNHFTRDGRDNLCKTITNRENLENFIGVICNNFYERAQAEKKVLSNNNLYNYYQDLAIRMGKNNFRESLIKIIMSRDFSDFYPQFGNDANYLFSCNNKEIFSFIIGPTIEKIFQIYQIRYENSKLEANVNIEDLRTNAKEQNGLLITRCLKHIKLFFNNNYKNDEERI